jgi:cytochrome c oxidase subunit 1
MFVAGLGPVANSAFAISTMFIAVPTGVKIFNWLGTIWKGDLHFRTPMMFSLGFIGLFIIGGLSGVTHAVVPSDYQQSDTYYVVAHFHYVLFGGAIFGLFAGIYYWFPKAFGRLLSERLGKWHFWLMFVGMNMTFGPFHILGMQGMPRRIYTYPDGRGWDFWNMVSTIGSFVIAVSILVFIANVIVTMRQKKGLVGNDPWDARTLEWTTTSPPPEYNFEEVPVVHELDDFWHKKYETDKLGQLVPIQAGASDTKVEEHGGGDSEGPGEDAGHGGGGHGIHLPSPSYWPFVAALGLPTAAYGVIYGWWWVAVLGGLITVSALYGWVLEPSVAE